MGAIAAQTVDTDLTLDTHTHLTCTLQFFAWSA